MDAEALEAILPLVETKNPQPRTTLGLRSSASSRQESCGVPVSKACVAEAVSSCLSFSELNLFQKFI